VTILTYLSVLNPLKHAYTIVVFSSFKYPFLAYVVERLISVVVN